MFLTFFITFFHSFIIKDYGTLLCWGGNELGMQTEPCVFNVIPAGKQFYCYIILHCLNFQSFYSTGRPDPLSNCTILNQTFDTFQIACTEGFDGGLAQEFVAELYILGQKTFISSMSSK